ncbi:S41 family peptidase [Deinococcus oregonensis]|uniref:S41 family peptidase n=1 Tax=Deinococcus oregonensis TaxID=1805970 RepID=A0ABV6B4Y9_9DEIO
MPSESSVERELIVKASAQAVAERYVFAAQGEALAAHLSEWWTSHGTASAENLDDFVTELTSVMRAHTPDRHLAVRPVHVFPRRSLPPSAMGVRQVAILDGNIGLIEISGFGAPVGAFPVLDAAMLMIASTTALILDVRQHRGGDSDTEAYFAGYFCREPTLINTFHGRDEAFSRQQWSAAHVHGPQYLDRQVVILTSEVTGSGGESFAYFMQATGQATLVGDITSGAAHPGLFFPVHEQYQVFVPTGRPESGITGGNWEGVGVTPTRRVPADEALAEARCWLGTVPGTIDNVVSS